MQPESQQEIMFQLSMFEQQMQQLQQQLQAVEQGILELNSLTLGLDELKGKSGEEILSPVGRGIFAKAKLISEELIVDIGQGNFVTKDIDGTKKLIEEQIMKLESIKIELQRNLDILGDEITKVIQSTEENFAETKKSQNSHGDKFDYSNLSKEKEAEHECKCHPGEKCECDDENCDGECDCDEDECECKK